MWTKLTLQARRSASRAAAIATASAAESTSPMERRSSTPDEPRAAAVNSADDGSPLHVVPRAPTLQQKLIACSMLVRCVGSGAALVMGAVMVKVSTALGSGQLAEL